ncbi:putative DNA recombination and repair protein RecA [Arabidopsis thaliana]
MYLSRAVSPRNVPVFSTGSFALDVALGVGGLPKGRLVEIYGPEASGKTALALHMLSMLLIRSLAKAIGVNTENLLLSQPDCGKQALSLVDTLIQSGSVDVIVVDSVAALVPKGELEGEMGDAHMAIQARLMSQALREIKTIYLEDLEFFRMTKCLCLNACAHNGKSSLREDSEEQARSAI